MINVVQGNVLRFLPSFLLQRQHVDTAIELLHTLLRAENSATVDTTALVGANA
jgi:4-aminobutyrate aminotransferase-like enzyme